MAYTTTNTTLAATTGVSGVLSKIAARYKAYRLYRDTFDGLSALTNRELADLGLSRAELHQVAADAAYK